MTDEGAGAPGGAGGKAGAAGAAAPRVPITLYERWQAAMHVDGVALGRRVRELREANGWTQADLSVRTGVPEATISELENGLSARPRPALYMTMAQGFGFETPGAMLGVPEAARPPGTHPAGLRGVLPAGPGPLTLEALVASLLRGVWAAQTGQPGQPGHAPAPGVEVAPAAGPPADPAAAPAVVGRLPGLGPT